MDYLRGMNQLLSIVILKLVLIPVLITAHTASSLGTAGFFISCTTCGNEHSISFPYYILNLIILDANWDQR